MAVPVELDPNGVLVAAYRAIGKLTYGHSSPTHSTDYDSLDEAFSFGEEQVAADVWIEFYIKTMYRRRGAVRP